MIKSTYEFLLDGSHIQINAYPDGHVEKVAVRGPCSCITLGCTLGRNHEEAGVRAHNFPRTCDVVLDCGGDCRFAKGHAPPCSCIGNYDAIGGCVGPDSHADRE